jgi:dipeptidyl aminopeptidase/acylaminoacyl peptidase
MQLRGTQIAAIVLLLSLTAAAKETPATDSVAVVEPGANLVVEGVPAIPQSLADALRPYTEFRAASICDWHPVRSELLVSTDFAETMQLHVVKSAGGARTQLTFFKEPVGEASFQPTKGDYFVFARDSGGNENYQKYRFDIVDGPVPAGNTTLLTDGTSRNTDGVWSNTGDRFVYGSTRRTGNDVDIWSVDPREPKSDKLIIKLDGGGWRPLDFSPDDRHLLVVNDVSINESYLWLVDVSSGNKTPLTPKVGDMNVAYGGGQFSPDGKRIYVTTDRDSEFQRLAYIELATKRHVYLSNHINWDIDQFSLSWDGKTVAFVANEDGRSVLRLLDTATNKEKAQPDVPTGIIGDLRWHKNNRDLGFNFLDSRAGSDVYSLDTSTGKLERWTFSETGGINTKDFTTPELVRWKSFDGKEISGWLYRPPARFSGKRPAIINIHGGPESQARPWLSAGSSYLVNELGIAIIYPNVRGSAGYGKTFLTLDNGFNREGSYKDIGSLLDWIAERDDLDADRVMVMGGSYGGFMTLAVATKYADRIRGAIDIVGISNLVTFLENTSGYRQDLRRVEYGDERNPKMREFLNRIAPLNNAAKITKPLFIVQGGNDPRVPLSEAEQMLKTVKANGTPVWYLMAKDEGHGFLKRKNQDFLLYSMVLFVEQHLLGEK